MMRRRGKPLNFAGKVPCYPLLYIASIAELGTLIRDDCSAADSAGARRELKARLYPLVYL